MASPQYNYLQIIGDCFPDSGAYLPEAGDPYNYDDLVWVTAPVAKATLEASDCAQDPEAHQTSEVEVLGNPDVNTTLQWDGTNWIPTMYLPPSQHIHVSKNGNDTTGNGLFNNPYLTLNAALSSITDSSITKPYVVTVHPGLYNESPISIAPFICISGVGHNATHIMATDNSNPLIIGMNHTFVMDCAIHGPDSSSCLYITNGSTNFGGQGLIFISGNVGVEVDGGGSPQGGRVLISNSKLYSGVSTGMLALNGGTIECSDITNNSSSKAFNSDGINSTIWIQNASVDESVDALYANNGGVIYASTCNANGCTNVIHIGPSIGSPIVTESRIDVLGIQTKNTQAYDIYVENENSIVKFVGGTISNNKISVPDGYSKLHMLFQDSVTSMNPRSEIHIHGDFVVGRPEVGSDSWFGQGDPYSRGMTIFTTDDTAGGSPNTSDGGNFIDVTETATHRDVPDVFSFQGTGANHTILVGVSLSDGSEIIKHWGYITHVKTAAVESTPKSFIIEIWNGTNWEEYGSMTVHSTEYYRYSNNLFIRPNNVEILRLGVDNATVWQSKTINGVNALWSRIRITNALTTAPTFHHFIVTPSMVEINVDGTQSFHGKARFRQTVIAAGNIYGESGGVTSTSSAIGSGGLPTGWDHEIGNSHLNNDGDAIYMQFILPRGVCTSCPMRVRVIYEIPDSGGSSDGTIIISLLPIEVENVLIADPSGGIEPIARTLSETKTIDAKQAHTSSHSIENTVTKKLHSVTSDNFILDDHYEGDMVAVRVELDNDGSGNKDITIWSLEVNAAVWTHGERL